jgi:hypothetical protein
MKKENKLQIRNSTAEFLIFSRQAGEDGIEVRVAEETVWLTQKLIGVLFGKGRSTITEHLKNIFETGELDEGSVCRDFRHTAEDQAERRIPMTMEDWAQKLNAFLKFNERDILDNPGKVSQEVAKAFAESEFEKYRIVQDRLFESDFDRHIMKALEDRKKKP